MIRQARANGIVLCFICGKPIGIDEVITAEHVVPVRDGGTNDLHNLRPAHSKCNSGWRSYSKR